MAYYKAGAAVRDITPSVELIIAKRIWLWGMGTREYPCQGVNDLISTRALVIRDDAESTVILVSVDIGALDPAMTAAVRERVKATHGIAGEYVCINVSHTHGAPVPASIPSWQKGVGYIDPTYYSFLSDQIVGVIDDAFRNLQTAEISWGRGATNIGNDRHFPMHGLPSTYDPTLDVLKVVNPRAHSGLHDFHRPVIAIVFFAGCHPVCRDVLNYVYSDFPGVTRTELEKQGGIAMFMQGYAGTCNPGSATVAKDVDSVGLQLAADVNVVLSRPMVTLQGAVDAWLQSVNLPFQPLDTQTFPATLQWAQAVGAERNDPAYPELIERWESYMSAFRDGPPDSLPTQLQGIRIGTSPNQWYLLASSHEVTMDFGPVIRGIWPYPRVTVAAYSNSQLSYLPSKYVLLNPDNRDSFPTKALDNYEGAWSFLWYGHRGPLTTDVDEIFIQGHINLLDPGWTEIGHAELVTGMTSWNGKLYCTTANNKLWRRDPVTHDIPWEDMGHADSVVGLAATNGLLYCATQFGRLWQRSPDGFDLPWQEIGHAELISAMTALNGVLYATTTNNKLWCRTPVDYDVPWEDLGHAMTVVGLAAAGGKLLCVTADDNLHWRDPVGGDVPWHHYGFAEHVVGMASIGETLYVATREGKLWQRQM